MKNLKKSFGCGAGYLKFAGCVIAVAGLVLQAKSQAYNLAHKNSSVDIDVASGPGAVANWQVDGVDQLFNHWFYYRVGAGGPEAPIQNIDATPTINQYVNNLAARILDVTYANSDYNVRIGFSLTGQAVGSGKSTFSETVTLNNTSLDPLEFHFFQYSDFDLGNIIGGQSVQFYQNGSGLYYKSIQNDGSRTVTETVTPASHIEAALYNQTLVKLTDGNPTILNDNANIGPGDVTFAYQWDVTIAPGDSFVISKILAVVPEPSSLALVTSGMLALAFFRRRGKK